MLTLTSSPEAALEYFARYCAKIGEQSMPTPEEISVLAMETDETIERVFVAWQAFCVGCRERKEAESWLVFSRRWKLEETVTELRPR